MAIYWRCRRRVTHDPNEAMTWTFEILERDAGPRFPGEERVIDSGEFESMAKGRSWAGAQYPKAKPWNLRL